MTARVPTITAEEFDRLADLSPDDPAGNLEPYMDYDKALRPGRLVQRVNVDFPIDLLRAIDREATRMGVTRQAFIKVRLADGLTNASEVARGTQQSPQARTRLTQLKDRLAREAAAARAKRKHS